MEPKARWTDSEVETPCESVGRGIHVLTKMIGVKRKSDCVNPREKSPPKELAQQGRVLC